MNRKLFLIGLISAVILASCTTGTENAGAQKADNASAPAAEEQKTASIDESTPAEDTSAPEARPSEATADLPNLDNAFDYNFYDGGTLISFGFKVQGDNLVALCGELEGKLKEAGWERTTEGMNSESEDNIYREFANATHRLTEGCSLTDGVPTFALMKKVKK